MSDKPTPSDIEQCLQRCKEAIDRVRAKPECEQYVLVDYNTYKRYSEMTEEDFAKVKERLSKGQNKLVNDYWEEYFKEQDD